MSQNNFLLPAEAYQRSINPVNDWIRQTALYASKMTGKPYPACQAHLLKKLKNGEIPFNNPKVVYFERGDNLDRAEAVTTLTGYLRAITDNNEILAPTFTAYLHPSVLKSTLVEYLDVNVAKRKKNKKLSQKYEAEKNESLQKYYHNAQDNDKRANNSVSGGFVAEGSVIQNPSAHSTLTSTTRSISSLSNASNERLIEGNRHYYSPQIALNNLISIVAETDHAAIDAAIQTYGLVYPSVEDTMACVSRSMDLYKRDHRAKMLISAFVERLTPTERASIVYTGDLYHLRVLNESFIRTFLTKLSRRGDATPIDNPEEVIQNTDEQFVNYAHQICLSLVAGIGKDYSKIPLESRYILANTCRNLLQVVDEHRVFLKAFFLTKNSPATIATIPSMIRRSVVLSDTDSTMFSVDNWVTWYFGALNFSDEGYALAGGVMFLATQSIAHLLALFSANMNIEKSRLHILSMKPEYVFPVFAQTSVAKHYYTAMKVKEGGVYSDIKMEIKGVHMKDSSLPVNIIESAAKEMEFVIREVMAGKKLSLLDMIHKTAALEREIVRSVFAGETNYLKRVNIKERKAYKVREGSDTAIDMTPYQYYTLWERAFAPTHGSCKEPPYVAVRIPLNLQNPSQVQSWLARLENQHFAQAFAGWMTDNNKKLIKSLPIPIDHCSSHGVPPELKAVIDTRKIVLSLTKSYRNILESMGYFSKKDMLIMEQGY